MADSMTVLRKAGPPGTRRNIAVFGDGFTAADQPTYNQWVDDKLIKGVFGHDYYSEDASAYNIYRVNLESVDSGVSVRTYDEKGPCRSQKLNRSLPSVKSYAASSYSCRSPPSRSRRRT
jgi:hypothetical protein